MIPEYLKLKNLGDKLSKLALLGGRRLPDGALSAVAVLRVTDGAKIHIASGIPGRRLYITADSLAAKSAASKLASFPDIKAVYLPHRDDVLMHRKGFSPASVFERSSALSAMAFGDFDVAVVSADALLQKIPARELVKRYTLELEKETIVDPVEAADRLARAGYVRRDMISEQGEFALRGDILDIYVCGGNAVRINFFDELIENIKNIDPVSMLALNEIERLRIPPASDVLLDEKALKTALEKLSGHPADTVAAEVASALHEGACPPSAVWAVPFAEGASESLFDYFDDPDRPCELIFDEPKVISEKLAILYKEFAGRLKPLFEAGEILPEHSEAIYPQTEIKRRMLTLRKISFTSLNLSNPLFEPTLILQPKCRPVTKYYLDPSGIYSDLNNFIISGFKVLICCGSAERAKGVVESLISEGIYAAFSEDGNSADSVIVTPLGIENGFIYPDLKLAVIGVSECVGRHRGEDAILRKPQFSAPKAGDYVVHRLHGVGICEGTQIMKAGDFEKEYVVLRYRDGDKLYVATDQMDNLQKFVGEEHPALNKLGGREFEREKEKVRKSVRKLAVNLLELYAKREKQKGFVYSPDTVWQHEFEDSFEYDETADQLKAVAEVKNDMESGKIMDRLLVGDVGFGKTEVAFRAMFKTVLDGKQAALLAPTTILARQHHENLAARLKPFGIECAMLSRLQKAAENREVVKRLADGTLHMVIATHKVLGNEIKFHDLGLLVLDEEQRFGVEHKEKLKEKYPLVNVLTLSATPIPRTLNMALSGVRDISMLETAPKGRLPIQTYVAEYSDTLVVDAINRECARGGQTLILLNDIEALEPFASRIGAALPSDVRIITAHGQMAGGELEPRIEAFYDKRYDVLVATTIIENGIDLPDANTLIVVDSGRFGLAQLYQLRGRVGRRGVLAHAYFTVPPSGVLSDTAEKRLQALLDNTEIGSGFKVALSDLSIRGAGNLLGAEQHGHIERVGYEMYIDLLKEAVEELRTGEPHREVKDVEMKVDVPAFVREGYISGRDKLRIYKKISSVSGFNARDELISELEQIYGPAEKSLVNLIDISLIKNMAKGFDVSRVIVNRGGAGINFYNSDVFSNQALMNAVSRFSDRAVLTSTLPPSLIFDAKNLSPEEKLTLLKDFFRAASEAV